jgi:UDP-N-acetylglucosamine transferase subunit ALG13
VILLTVGTQLPFDRFVRLVDAVAPTLAMPVLAQIGAGRFRPVNMQWRDFIGPVEFEALVRDCAFIVSHAGIGTVVMARRHAKPLVLFPRLGTLDEHRNDHQVATLRALEGRRGIYTARDGDELAAILRGPLEAPDDDRANPERDRLRDAVGGFMSEQRARWLGARARQRLK